MKNHILIGLVAVLCSACAVKNTTILPVTSITIQSLNEESLAIRALDYTDELYWFAGNKGFYGTVDEIDGVLLKQLPVVAQNLEFRAIATTKSYTYIMSAGSPALLYRITKATGDVQELYRDTNEKAFYDAMKFWNDNEGIIMGDPIDNCFSILKTTDGGKSFKTISCDAFPDFVAGEAAFAASNSNIAIHGNEVWLATGGKRARVFHSYDRGEHWEVVDTPIIAGGAMTGIFAMDFYDNKLGVVIGGNWDDKSDASANKALTKDGGKTWQLLQIGNEPKYCSDIQFIPGSKGKEILAVGSEGIWYSANTGTTWFKLSDAGFYTIVMKDAHTGVLAGKNRISSFKLNRS